VVGWALADHLEASLAIEALDMALAARDPAPMSLIHHSDRGVQYTSIAYLARLNERKVAVSMSRVGNPYDNAKVGITGLHMHISRFNSLSRACW
jgi:transposase InsO family protein